MLESRPKESEMSYLWAKHVLLLSKLDFWNYKTNSFISPNWHCQDIGRERSDVSKME